MKILCPKCRRHWKREDEDMPGFDELPDIAQQYIWELRAEAAKYRRQLRELTDGRLTPQ